MDIQEIREKLKITQEDLARDLGVTVSTVNRWENGHTTPSRLATKTIQAYLDREDIAEQIRLHDERKSNDEDPGVIV